MGRYRKIDSRIWNDAKFSSLSDDGQFVFLFLLSHPHMTSLGAMRGTVEGLAAERRWLPERLRKGFREALAKGMIEHDETASFIGLPRFLKYNGPESPNVVKSWVDSLDLIPECHLKDELLQRVKAFLEGLHPKFLEAMPEAFRKALPNPEPEPEQEPEQTNTPYSPPRFSYDLATIPIPAVIDTEGFRAAWQRWLEHLRQKGARPSQLTLSDQLIDCVKKGESRAVAAIAHSIRSGWTGLFEDRAPKAAAQRTVTQLDESDER